MTTNLSASPDLQEVSRKEVTHGETFSERSEIVMEIINHKPDFYEKRALPLLLILLLLLLFSTWFVKSPDIIKTSAVLIGNNAPKEIIPRRSGKLTGLFANNNQQVKQGEMLGWIESSADIKQVLDLSARLDSSIKMMESGRALQIAQVLGRKFTKLGELQMSYQTFITAWQQYNDYLVNGFYFKRKAMLESDIESLESVKNNVATQRNISAWDNTLAKETFEMNKKLYEEKIISAEEYRRAQSDLLNKQLAIPEADMKVLLQQNQVRDKQKEIDQLNHDIVQQQLTFEQALQTLKSKVDDWLKQFTIQAPTNGTVVFALPLQQSQYIEEGKLLGYINPVDSKYYAVIKLSQNNFGKIDTGLKVQLRLDAYPYQEVGFINGTLDYVSKISIDSGFWGTVRLDNGLITNQNKTVQYINGLKGQGLIIARDMRLIQRIYYSVIKAASVDK